MFKGEESIALSTPLPDPEVMKKVQEALGILGRVRIDKRGAIEIDPKGKFGNLLTDTTMEGMIRKKGDGYDITIDFSCKPTVVNWVIITVGTLLCWGLNWLTVFAPLMDKKKVAKAVRNALLDIEEGVQGPT